MTDKMVRVFISSREKELEEERGEVEKIVDLLRKRSGLPLESIRLEDKRPDTKGSRIAYLEGVIDSDIYVGIIGSEYSKATFEEFEKAQDLEKPTLVFIKKSTKRDEGVDEFISKIKDPNSGVTYDVFKNLSELKDNSIFALMRIYHEKFGDGQKRKPDLVFGFLGEEQIENEIEIELTFIEYQKIERKPTGNLEPPSILTLNREVARSLAGINKMRDTMTKIHTGYESVEKYEEAKRKWEQETAMISEIKFILENKGNLPAKDIDIYISFPKSFKVMTKRDVPEKPRNEPLSFMGLSRIPPILGPNEPYNGPWITEEKETSEVSYRIDKLKHHHQYELNPIFVSSPNEEATYEIEYVISTEELLKPKKGAIKIRVKPETEIRKH